MKRNILSVAFAMAAFIGVSASPIGSSQAAKIAGKFVHGRSVMFSGADFSLSGQNEETSPYYVFNVGSDNGFVIVAGDDAVDPILAYSYEGHFDTSDMPANVKSLMDSYKMVISEIQKADIPAKAFVRKAGTKRESISPLMKTLWNQDHPYNDMCPIINGKRSVVGCVPLAMAQVLAYYQWPAYEIAGVPGYTFKEIFPEYGEPKDIDVEALPATTFNWDDAAIGAIGVPEFDNAVAEICRYAGQACRSAYSPKGTGSNSFDMVYGMTNYLDYTPAIMVLSHNTFGDEDKWEDIIYNELAGKRPVIMGGSPETGYGHQFVCDGYENSKYHINWGWGGYCNGYFKLSNLCPSDAGIGGNAGDNYSYNYEIVVNSVPDANNFQVYSKPVVVAPGTEQAIVLKFNCDEDRYVSMQFDVKLPEGVSFVENGEGAPAIELNTKSDHTLKYNRLASGEYRFVITSPTNSTISMTDNNLITMEIATAADAVIDNETKILTYNGVVCSTMYKGFNFNPYSVPLKLAEPEIIGDADDDDFVDRYDFDVMRKAIMNDNYNEIALSKSDMNMDGSVDVADLMLLARKLQIKDGKDTYFVPTMDEGFLSVDDRIYGDSENPKNKYVYVHLNNIPAAKAVQFDMKLPKNAYITYIWSEASNRTNSEWYSYYQYIREDTYRIMLYHPEGKNIKKHFDAVVCLLVEYDGDVTTEYSDIIVSTTDYKKVTGCISSIPSGIDDVTSGTADPAEDKVYTLEGMRLKSKSALPSGVYIINGKKTVIR